MNEHTQAEIKEEVSPAETVVEESERETSEPSQSPIKKELDKARQPRSKREKLLYTKKRIDEQLAELDDEDGTTQTPIDEDENKPVTVGMLKARERDIAKRTALSLADDIEDDDERELTKHYLQTRIVPSGNPKEDLRLARAAVNSLKNEQIVAETTRRRSVARTSSSGSGAPALPPEDVFTPTSDEAALMRPPFSLTVDDIKKARKAQK